MKNTHIRVIVLLGCFTLVGIISSQVFWVSKTLKNQEEQFAHNVQMALKNVVESLCEINGNDISNDPIDQVSSGYFIARTNYSIDLSSLDYLIKAEFAKRNLKEDFEFGVYDCQTQSMVYGDFVSYTDDKIKPLGQLPKLDNDEYYFGVYFPNKSSGLTGDLGFWKFTSVLTALITVFFAYAMFVILRQKRLSEIQKDFVNNMTHEFKTPLATLILSAEALAEETQSDRGKNYASIVKKESQKLLDHVNRFLDTTASENLIKRKSEKFHVNTTLAKVADRFSSVENRIITSFHDDALIRTDLDIFEQTVFNLIDNALKYGAGEVRIKTSIERNSAVIEVINDGPEIPAKEQKKIFKKFYRINTGNLHQVKGFGLGLYFVNQSVKKMKGTIRLQSENGVTCFSLKIPLAL